MDKIALRFRDVPQFVSGANYSVHVGWNYLSKHYYHHVVEYGLDVNPNFQRAHVWTLEQKVKYVEYALRGGRSGMDIYLNCPTWGSGKFGPEYPNGWYVLVDGKQRLDAVLGFLSNEFPVFGGNYRRDYSDRPNSISIRFTWNVNQLETIGEVYQWYIDLNSGGTVHTESEISKVQDLLRAKIPYVRITGEEAQAQARLNCEAVLEARSIIEREEAETAKTRAEAEAARVEKKATKKNRAKPSV